LVVDVAGALDGLIVGDVSGKIEGAAMGLSLAGMITNGTGGKLGEDVTETLLLLVNSDAAVIRDTAVDGVCDGCMVLLDVPCVGKESTRPSSVPWATMRVLLLLPFHKAVNHHHSRNVVVSCRCRIISTPNGDRRLGICLSLYNDTCVGKEMENDSQSLLTMLAHTFRTCGKPRKQKAAYVLGISKFQKNCRGLARSKSRQLGSFANARTANIHSFFLCLSSLPFG
jgi:hypothetical protein